MSRYSAVQAYWVLCHDCGFEWIATYANEHNCLYAADDLGEECPECHGDEIEPTTTADREGLV